jgi:hypothetical protein
MSGHVGLIDETKLKTKRNGSNFIFVQQIEKQTTKEKAL